MNVGAEYRKKCQSTGTSALFKVYLLPETNLSKMNTLNCSLHKTYRDALQSDKPVV